MNKNIEELMLLFMYLTSREEKGYVNDGNNGVKETVVKAC